VVIRFVAELKLFFQSFAFGLTRRNEKLYGSEDEVLKRVKHRYETVLRLPEELTESFQLLHYNQGQYYLGHLDFFAQRGLSSCFVLVSKFIFYSYLELLDIVWLFPDLF
jgi:hypothetical protein